MDLRKAMLQRLRKLLAILRHRAYWRALPYGVAAAVEHDRVPFADRLATIVDVGASRGQFALVAHRRFPQARIECFEPLEEPRGKLARVAPWANVHPIAAGLAPGEMPMHVSAADDSSSLLPIGGRQVQEFPETYETHTAGVRVERLDEVLSGVDRPALLKIDVQGAELDVIRGAEGLLAQIDLIYVECSFVELYEGQPLVDEIMQVLHEYGYRLRGVFNVVTGRDGAALQGDFLFVRSEPVGDRRTRRIL